MNSSYLAYRILTTSSAMVVVPSIWLHHRFRGHNFDRFYQRMGYYPQALSKKEKGRPRIWMHAASVGEVGVAYAIGKALLHRYPRCDLVLSTIREQGYARAQTLFGEHVPCFFAPLDLVSVARRALDAIQPDVLVLLETEIWPNLIVNAHRKGVSTALVNGRISVRTINSYRRVRPLLRYILSHLDAFSMISDEDAQRLDSLGANPSRITVYGNAKFDGVDPMENPDAKTWATRLYGLHEQTQVMVAGSTRYPEEPMLLEAFFRLRDHFPHLLLIIAPRHIERVDQIQQWVADHGLACQLRSQLGHGEHSRNAPVVILDTMGELSETYSVADIVFCGGSLVPKGGQNILEPAMWGKPILFGPSMEDFADARQLIAASGGGAQVANTDALTAAALDWLHFPEKAVAAGLAARKAILPHRGAAQKHAEVISNLIDA